MFAVPRDKNLRSQPHSMQVKNLASSRKVHGRNDRAIETIIQRKNVTRV